LDASALLAVLLQERGADVVEQQVAGAAISTVNYSEVLKKAVEKGGTLEDAASVVRSLQLDIVPFEEWNARDAARLYPTTKDKGLSFADRACLSLALELDARLYTADKRLAGVDVPLDLILIREAVASGGKKRK
jgi:PIN domain nuclease of toxin-antitoxin system